MKAKYEDVRLKFQLGQLVLASNEATEGYEYCKSSYPDWAWRFRILKGEILAARGLSRDALALLAAELPPSLARDEVAVRRRKAQAFAEFMLQQYDESQAHLADAERLATAYQPGLLGEVLQTRAVTAILRNQFSTAESDLKHSLQLARQPNQRLLESSILGNLGLSAMRRQHYGEAIDWYESSLRIARQSGAKSLEVKSLGNLGWCYYKMGDLERALSLFEQAQQGSLELGLDRDRIVWLTNIGTVHYDQRAYGTAATSYGEALAAASRLQNSADAAVCLNNLALVAIDQKQFDKAEQYNHKALELKRASKDRSSELYSLLTDSQIALGRRDYEKAEKLLHEVIPATAEDISLHWQAQAELADVYAADQRFEAAEREFRNALATIDAARSSLIKQEYRLSFLTSASRFYNDYIDFLVSRRRVREALSVAEHSRARTLAEGLGLTDKINSHHLYPASDAQAQAVARQSNAVILYYWLKPERSYLWAITRQKLALFSLPGQDEINAAVQAWRKALVGPRDPLEAGNPAGEKLYEMLVAPAQKLIPAGSDVVIVADGSLHGLNFETLLVPGSRPHYWIEDVQISNANSLELLAASERKRQASGRGLLLIGDPLTAGTEFPPLARAEDEVQRVEAHFDGNQRVAFTRDQATATAYRDSQPGHFAYIHFVAHGTSSRISPLDSAVVLSKEGDAYKLYARDIVQQPLHANLVTISACYGAGERAYTGEGLVGLSWAFLRAGAHNVIGALWEVNDISTPQLMDTMYTDLQKGRDPATALRAAKLAMLHSDSVFRRPFYWAPFQLYVGS